MNRHLYCMLRSLLLLSLVAVSFSGCAPQQIDNKPRPNAQSAKNNEEKQGKTEAQTDKKSVKNKAQDKASPPKDEEALIAKELALSIDGVKEAKAVAVDHDLYLGLEVYQLQRFQLKKIRQQAFQKVKKEFPDKEIHVSTDRKIYREIGKLEKEVEKKEADWVQWKKKLDKINKDMKG